MIPTYTKDFSWGENDPNSPDFEIKKNKKNSQIFMVGSQEYKKFLFFFQLSYLVCSQIWLNHLIMDDHHL